MTEFKEQYRLTLSNAGKVRNRCEAHVVKFAQQLLANPVALTIGQVRMSLAIQLEVYKDFNPSHGTCRVSDISITSRTAGQWHLVKRSFAIIGRGRKIYTLLVSETITKNITCNCAPVVYSNSMPV